MGAPQARPNLTYISANRQNMRVRYPETGDFRQKMEIGDGKLATKDGRLQTGDWRRATDG